jgi:eukaryotic-like serine/threonine-protein kinase
MEALAPGLAPTERAALARVIGRLHLDADFPIASSAIGAINRITEGSDTESNTMLASAVLEDVALTHKILRVVNSATFRHGGPPVSTVSRAVMILGFETVRNIAVALLLIDNLQDRTQADALRETFARALLAGLVARSLAPAAGVRRGEESFVCALFHDLGRMVTLLHLPADARAIAQRAADDALPEAEAARLILGVPLEAIGVAVAKHWGFPETIAQSQRRFGPNPVFHVGTAGDRVHLLTALSHGLADVVATGAPKDRRSLVKDLMDHYGHGLGLTEPALHAALDDALARIREWAATFELQLHRTALSRQILAWAGEPVADAEAEAAGSALPNALPEPGLPAAPAADPAARAAQAVAVLTAGIQDVSNALTGDYRLNDLLRMVLETMYRSLCPKRVLLAIRDVQGDALQGRFGFGPEVQTLARSFRIPLGAGNDVFRLVLTRGVDLLVKDADAPEIRDRIPAWFREATPARTFVLFPIVVKDRPMGLIYAEHDAPGDLVIPEQELDLLRTLRNQAVLAIRQAA